MQFRVSSLSLALGVSVLFACSSGADEKGSGDDDNGSSSSSSSSGQVGSSSGGSGSSSGGGGSSSSSGNVEPVTLRGKVQKLMNSHCTGCHGSVDPEALLDLTDVGLTINADSFEMPGEKVVVPGDPDSSVLVLAIEGDPPGSLGRMPKRARALDKADTDLVRQWVAEGAE